MVVQLNKFYHFIFVCGHIPSTIRFTHFSFLFSFSLNFCLVIHRIENAFWFFLKRILRSILHPSLSDELHIISFFFSLLSFCSLPYKPTIYRLSFSPTTHPPILYIYSIFVSLFSLFLYISHDFIYAMLARLHHLLDKKENCYKPAFVQIKPVISFGLPAIRGEQNRTR